MQDHIPPVDAIAIAANARDQSERTKLRLVGPAQWHSSRSFLFFPLEIGGIVVNRQTLWRRRSCYRIASSNRSASLRKASPQPLLRLTS